MTDEATFPMKPTVATVQRASTLAAFARALVLPFEHPLRLLLVGPVACGLAILVWSESLYGMSLLAFGGDRVAGRLWLEIPLAILFLGFWGCAWQRVVGRRPVEPTLRWLGRSFRQMPGYALAIAVAIAGPSLIWLFLFGMTYLIMAGNNLTDAVTGWWAMLGVLILLLPGLWLFGRLSFLPAAVAARGWSGAIERTRQLGQRRDFGLALAFALFVVVGFFLIGVTSLLFFRVGMAVLAMTEDMQVYATSIQLFYLAGQTIAMTLLGSWVLGFPALLLRLEAREVEIDPAAFD